MKLEILSFNGKLFKSHSVISVTAMTKMGEITVLENHSSLITSLKPSVLKIIHTDENNIKQEEFFAIGGGILEVTHSSMKILIDMLVTINEIDLDIAEKAKQKAIELMETYKNSKDKVDMEKFIEAEDMLLKSVAQLKLGNLR
ncbi:MAG: ATP synthase F1 subunit epsilon [Candidatus Gracilibacteria bacterium]|nr:ATP synthase F1 subunit epsilon [Candidatus Gracilibacteria bacterium]